MTYGRRFQNPMTESTKLGASLNKEAIFRQLGLDIQDYGADMGKYSTGKGVSNVAGNIISNLLLKSNPVGFGTDLLGKWLSTLTKGAFGFGIGDIIGSLFGAKEPTAPIASDYTSKLTGPYMAGTEKTISDMIAQATSGQAPDNSLLMSLLMSGYGEFGPDIKKLFHMGQ